MCRSLHDDVLQDVGRERVPVFGAFWDPLLSALHGDAGCEEAGVSD